MSEFETGEQGALPAPVDLGGGITVTALTDAVADHRQPIEECFPGEPNAGWPALKDRYPETVGADGRWRLPVNTFLVRAPERTILVDQGVGSERTIASDVFQVVGSLPARLARFGVAPESVDKVIFTHVHEDHVGWADDPESGEPTFPNALYHVFDQEWAANHEEETPDWIAQALDPLRASGRLMPTELGQLTDEIEAVPLLGHSAGHVGLIISGPEAKVVLVGDAFNHPYQVTQPELPSIADFDRNQAVQTRHAILEKVGSGEWPLLASAHLPGAWWTAVAEGDELRWKSRAMDLLPPNSDK